MRGAGVHMDRRRGGVPGTPPSEIELYGQEAAIIFIDFTPR
jgi:hypothetical protein